MTFGPPPDRQGFEIAIICALPLEANAVIALFDHHWENEEEIYGKAMRDPNAYTTGVIDNHSVVVVHMSNTGKVNAAGVAVGLRVSFPNIKLALVVGICGGVPSGLHHRHDIYLGDVIISQCLIQYDFGRQYPTVFEPKDTLEGGLGSAPVAIQSALRKLETDHHTGRLQEDTCMVLEKLQKKLGRAMYPGMEFDQLFKPSYIHQHRDPTACDMCGKDEMHVCADALKATCRELGCGAHDHGLVHRKRSANSQEQGPLLPSIHIGKMGSGDTVMKSAIHRDEIARKDGIIAFEMEGAGVSAHFPSLVIKGVCDYADSHKNKQWQTYATATAAACTKAFLKRWTSESPPHGEATLPPAKPVFMVGITRDDEFIGRQDDMEFLIEKLSTEGTHNRVALVALGGIG
jgi:nucleoside phosphorylase